MRLWRLSWPAMISGLSIPLLGLVDTSIVGRLDEPAALGAVALASWLFDLLYWSFGFLRMGTTGLIAQARGRGDTAELRVGLTRPLIIGAIAGTLVIALGQVIGVSALAWVAGDSSTSTLTMTLEIADTYFQARLWGGPAVLMNYACLGWLLGMGHVRLALLTQLTLNGLNAALSVWWGVWWSDRFGVAGVGFASAVAQWSALLIWGSLIWWRLCPKLEPRALIEALKVSAPWRALAALNFDLWVRTCLLLGSFGLLNAISARLGPLALSANALLLHLQSLQSFVLDGFAHGAEVIVGERVGRGDRRGYHRALRAGLELTMGAALVIALIYWVSAEHILGLLTHHDEVIREAGPVLIWAVISPLVSAPCFLLDGVMIGATESAAMRRGMIISSLVFALVLAIAVPRWGNHGLWLAFTLFMHARMWSLIPAARAPRALYQRRP